MNSHETKIGCNLLVEDAGELCGGTLEIEEGRYVKVYCQRCQARLQGIKQGRSEAIKEVLEMIDKEVNIIELARDSGFGTLDKNKVNEVKILLNERRQGLLELKAKLKEVKDE